MVVHTEGRVSVVQVGDLADELVSWKGEERGSYLRVQPTWLGVLTTFLRPRGGYRSVDDESQVRDGRWTRCGFRYGG